MAEQEARIKELEERAEKASEVCLCGMSYFYHLERPHYACESPTMKSDVLYEENCKLNSRIKELERQLRNAVTGEGCPHGRVRPSQCVDCIQGNL